MQKTLSFKGQPILNININCAGSDLSRKTSRFYAAVGKSFLRFCEGKLYKNAAGLYMQAADSPPEIFTADMGLEIKYEPEHIKIYLDIGINGEKTRRVHIWSHSGELAKPKKTKKNFVR